MTNTDLLTLKHALNDANNEYRKGNPTILDVEYDDMVDKLEKHLTPDEYTAFRDTLMEPSGEVTHKYTIGSLRKVKAEDDSLLKWVKNSDDIEVLHCSAKLDGISMVLEYNHGTLVSALTRGDGVTGVQQFDKIKHIVPTTLNTFTGFIRGEISLTFETFEDVKRITGTDYKNLRNTTVGLVNRKHTDIELVKCLNFYAYRIIGCKDPILKQFKFLEDVGFVVPIWKIVVLNVVGRGQNLIDTMVTIYDNMKVLANCELDGVVIHNEFKTVEDVMLPSNTIAFKVNDLIATTKILDIKWQLSRDGLMKPVAVLEPVELGGAMISRVTLHNYRHVLNYAVHYGDDITIEKAGDVIPHVLYIRMSETSTDNFISYPLRCPSCGSELVCGGVDLRCENSTCPYQLMSLVVTFIKRLGIKGVSEKSMTNFGITDYNSLLEWRPDETSKNEVKFYDEMMTKMFVSTKEILFSKLPCEGIGETLINKILDKCGYDTLICDIQSVRDNPPVGVGDKMFDRLEKHMVGNDRIVQNIINDVRFDVYRPDLIVDIQNQPLHDQSFCFTGSLKTTTRGDASKLVVSLGGTTKSGVSKGLTYLVTNSPDSGTSKNVKAQKLGTKIITEDEFIKLTSDFEDTGDSLFNL